MVRELGWVTALSAAIAGAVSGQQSITATALILERVEVETVDVEVRSSGGRLRVWQSEASSARGTRLLRRTYVGSGEEVTEWLPIRAGEGGSLRPERGGVRGIEAAGRELKRGERLLLDLSEELTITRLVAANS